ncbi:MAG: cupin domain-containing protein [Nitrospinota bacterium]
MTIRSGRGGAMAHLFGLGDGERVEMGGVDEPRGWRIQVCPQNTASERLSMGTQEIPPGGRIPVHLHEREEEILFFHAGEGEVEVDGAVHPVGPGMSVFLPPGVSHGVRNTGGLPIKLVWIFSPPGYEEVFRQMARRGMDHGEIEDHI